jgi:hypothetical protein
MESPPYYSSINPLWQEGREYGINEERERCIKKLREFAKMVKADGLPYRSYLLAINILLPDE